jgi:hypothetical protein
MAEKEIVINLVRIIRNNDSGATHSVAKGYAVTRCGIWYDINGYHKKKYTSHLHVPGTEPTCKSCRKIMGIAGWSWTVPKVKEPMQIYEFGDENSMVEPVWIRTNRKIELTATAKAGDRRYLKKIPAREAKFIDRKSGIDLIIT